MRDSEARVGRAENNDRLHHVFRSLAPAEPASDDDQRLGTGGKCKRLISPKAFGTELAENETTTDTLDITEEIPRAHLKPPDHGGPLRRHRRMKPAFKEARAPHALVRRARPAHHSNLQDKRQVSPTPPRPHGRKGGLERPRIDSSPKGNATLPHSRPRLGRQLVFGTGGLTGTSPPPGSLAPAPDPKSRQLTFHQGKPMSRLWERGGRRCRKPWLRDSWLQRAETRHGTGRSV